MVSKSSAGKGAVTPPARKKPRAATTKPDEPLVQVRIVAANKEEFRKFAETTPMTFACRGPRVNAEGVVTTHALMKGSDAKQAAKAGGVKVEIVAEPSARMSERRAEVGQGNRFDDPNVLPTGRGVLLRKPS
jgi:hypothetical protein